MEPITHFLTGAALSRAGFNRKTALATLTMTLAAEAPDIDIVTYFKGSLFEFAHHRGITHTFIGVPFVTAAVLLFVWIIHRVRMRSPQQVSERVERLRKNGYPIQPRWGLLYLFGLIAGFSHLLLDYTNNYGIRPFEPFSYHWYAWDIVFIFEPLLYVALIGGLVLPSLFRLINEEIGAKSRGPRGQVGAILALLGVLAIWGVRDYQHRKAVAAMQARVYQGADPIRASAFPYPAKSVYLVRRGRDPRLLRANAGGFPYTRSRSARQYADPLQARGDAGKPGGQVVLSRTRLS